MKEQLVSLYEYGDWVNQRLLEAAAALTEEQFRWKPTGRSWVLNSI
jgi:uncharacterized damage-inducible protein DinB